MPCLPPAEYGANRSRGSAWGRQYRVSPVPSSVCSRLTSWPADTTSPTTIISCLRDRPPTFRTLPFYFFDSHMPNTYLCALSRAIHMTPGMMGPCSIKSFTTLRTNALFAVIELLAFATTKTVLSGNRQSRWRTLDKHPTMITSERCFTTKTLRHTFLRTVTPFGPRRICLKWYPAYQACNFGCGKAISFINHYFCSGIVFIDQFSCEQLDDLSIIFPNHAVSSIADKFDHVVDVPPLAGFGNKQATYTKAGTIIRE